ncbi:MAG: hypothetical protein ACXVDI_26435, partial [Ktedonobacterales bacterium]
RVVIPPCQPPALVGVGMPRDAASQLGFVPYVATWLPDTVSWYFSEPLSSGSSIQLLPSQPRPLMRTEYAQFFPRPSNAYALHSVIAFDETTQPLGLTTNITVPGQSIEVTSTAVVEINGHAATYFELQSFPDFTGSTATAQTTVIGVEWYIGTLWVRVTAVTSGRYLPISTVDGDDIVAWTGTNRDEILQVARSAGAYTNCDRSGFTAS